MSVQDVPGESEDDVSKTTILTPHLSARIHTTRLATRTSQHLTNKSSETQSGAG